MIHVYSKMSHTQQHTLYIYYFMYNYKSTSPSMIPKLYNNNNLLLDAQMLSFDLHAAMNELSMLHASFMLHVAKKETLWAESRSTSASKILLLQNSWYEILLSPSRSTSSNISCANS